MLFNGFTEKWFREIAFSVGWQQHGGSGLTFTREDMLHMPIPELVYYSREANKQRKREADAIKSASKQKK